MDPLGSVTINEWRTHSPLGEADFVELFNCGPGSVDLSGAGLTDVVGDNGFRFPPGTVLPPGGFHVVYEEQLGFTLRSSGEHLVLFNPSRSRVIDSVKYGPQGLGISSGRFPDGQPEIQHLTHATPGSQNSPPTPAPVIINELMFHPLSGDDNEEYIELFNPGAHAVDLSGWKLTKGITFTFPLGTTLAPGGYVVVAKDRTRLQAKYPHLNSTTLLGDYGGVLGDDGDRIALVRPVAIVVEVGGISMNQLADAVVEEFEYQTGGAWGTWADRGGSSLERVDVRADARRPSSWADSDESEKAPWTLVEFTGVLDHAARSSDPADALDLVLLGEGECLVDDVEARVGAGANLVRNPDFATSFAFWSPQGNHVRSARSTDPTDPGSTVLHLRASSQGDTGANRIRSNLGSVINKGDTATLRARVRWLKGWPEVVLRLRGNGLEAYGRLHVSSQPGSPGLRNSRAVLNAGPSLDQLSHWPVLPRADEPIQVSVRVGDPDGIDAVGLRYRVDPSQVLLEVPLRDDGQGPDRFAGDGRFSGQIPGQARNAMVAFWIEATDAAASPGVSLCT
ncbi:MAG: lamin tail domain-containing protein [Verrucomicrobia bacterium]|nr:lamin tail domain-containing protein [Verrucomicrobiota bacterium]